VTVLHGQHSLDGAPCVGDPEISALDGSILERVFRWLGAEPPGGRRARDLFALARWGALPADQGADASLDGLQLAAGHYLRTKDIYISIYIYICIYLYIYMYVYINIYVCVCVRVCVCVFIYAYTHITCGPRSRREREASGYEHPCEREARERDIRLRALRALLVTAEVLTPRGYMIHPWRWSSRLGPVDPSF
jgi:hypothetical protein